MHLFNVYVRPILEYASIIWFPRFKYLSDEVESVQRRFTKFILPHILTYQLRLEYLNQEPLEDRRLRADAVALFRILHLHYAQPCRDYFHFSRSARRQHDLSVHYSRSRFTSSFFFDRAIHLWNQLPVEVRSLTSISSFRNALSLVALR